MALRLKSAQLEELRRHGEATYPYECCGVLVGERTPDGSKTVLQAIPCNNADTSKPQVWYQIDPRDLVRIQRQAYERWRRARRNRPTLFCSSAMRQTSVSRMKKSR